ncbi:MAG: NFACT family protein [Thermovirgaceae bacterium]|nr:NFACT family protein [Synergistales bacterium]MDY0179019.1 NFACT family protein [Synergistaceae bacterium]HRW88006.1 NFACT family protein [Thermovirgaceae bacterium]MDD5513800.1 NFACT family protein [Synergistales bacterium]NLV64334.1 hypothetical protein [Synergistaceae bacterium]
MSMQPELFDHLIDSIKGRFLGGRCSAVECGEGWTSLAFGRSAESLFLCWKGPFSGLCLARREDISELTLSERIKPPFGAALKKHIAGSSLTGVERVSGDRVIELSFSRGIGPGIALKSYLICEFVGRRNDLVLIDSGGLIIDSASHSLSGSDPGSWRLPGNPYLPPSSPFSALSDIPKGPGIFYSLNKVPKIGRKLSASLRESWHLFNTPQWEVHIIPERCTEDHRTLAGSGTLQELGGEISFFGILLGVPVPSDEGILPVLGKMVLEPLVRSRLRLGKARLAREIERRMAKIAAMKRGMENRITQAGRARELKRAADLILEHSHGIPKGAGRVSLPRWNGEGYERIDIELDPAKTAAQNAQDYYRRYRKDRLDDVDLHGKAKILDDAEREASEMLLRVDEAESISEINSLADEIWTNPDPLPGKGDRDPLKRLCFRGSQVLVGTNRKANRKATFVLASPEDLWFHARNVPGAHVILRTTKKGTLPEDVLEFASSLAAFYSRSSESLAVAVDYTRRKYVKAVPGTISEVTYSNARTLTVSPDLWKRLLQEKA